MRNEFRQGRSVTDVSAYNARLQLGREVADVLRRNVVQGVKVSSSSSSGDGAVPSSTSAHVRDEDSGVYRTSNHFSLSISVGG